MDNITFKEGFIGQKMIVLPNNIKKLLITNAITKSFYITDLGYFPRADHHYRRRNEGANEFIFIYCTEGEGWLEIENVKIEILPNQFFIIPKKIRHNYGANDNNPWSIFWMHFDGSIANNLVNRYNSNSQKSRTIPFINDRIKLFNHIFKIFESDYIETQMEYANILSLKFISSFIFQDLDQSVNISDPDNLVGSIINFLQKNIDQTYSIKDISEEFKYSPSYIFTLFKKRTGYSLIHFFNLKKMQKACEYLNYTDLSVKEISYKMNFQDPSYFSRLFKKLMGVSPKRYKQNNRN